MEGAEYIQIVHEYLDTVYRVALSSSKNPHDAEDIVQSTFLKLLEGNREFRDEEHIRRWLIRVTINAGGAEILRARKERAVLGGAEAAAQVSRGNLPLLLRRIQHKRNC